MTDAHVEYTFYVYEQDEDDPRFSFWLEMADAGGMALYDRPPEGAGMWLCPEQKTDYESTAPSTAFEDVIGELAAGGIDADRLDDLAAHERYFVQVLHGTIAENPDGIPEPVWVYIDECRRRAE